MADDTSLLLRIRGDSSGGKAAVAETRAAISSLRQTSTTEFKQMQQVSTVALSSIQSSITSLTSRIPVLGGTLSSLTSELSATAGASTQTGGAIAALGGPIGIAITGTAVLTVGVVALGKALFDATAQTAAFQGKFQDLSQQVGVTVETLSTLDVLASTTGGSIESVTASLGIFQKNLEAAHDPTSKEAKLLKELGVTSLDTETALRQTIKGLFDMGTGAKQTAAVLELFGRGGKFVNAILKESKGDLDAATKKFQEMGLVVSGPAAAAADQFNDSYGLLQRQLAAVGFQITQDTIPVFTLLFQEIAEGLGKNKDEWANWSNFIAFETAAAIASVKTFVQFVASRGTLSIGSLFEANVEGILGEANQLKNKLNFEADIERIQRLTASILAGKPGDGTGTAKKAGADPEQARAAKSISLAQQALEESTRANREALERERRLDLKSIDDWKLESIAAAQTHLSEQQKLFAQEEANINRFVKTRADALLFLTELDQKRTKAVNATAEQILKIEDEAKKKQEQSLLRTEQQLLAIEDERRRAQLEIIRAALERHRILESDALNQQIKLLTEAFEQRKIISDLELAQETTSTERRVELTNARIEAEIRFTSEFKRLTQERIEASLREGAAAVSPPGGGTGVTKLEDFVFDDSALGPPPDAEKRFRGLQAAIDDVGSALGNLVDASANFKTDFGDVIGGAIGDLAFGIGRLVEDYVLLGETGPAALRKLLAATLAHLAAEAAVKAVFQLAEGFAALFYNPAQAAAHFTSAAIFGSIAGVAAVAGRSVAGDLFKQQPNAGGSGAQGAGALETITTRSGRNQTTQSIRITVVVQPDGSKFGDAVTAHVVQDIGTGGEIRNVMAGDGRAR